MLWKQARDATFCARHIVLVLAADTSDRITNISRSERCIDVL